VRGAERWRGIPVTEIRTPTIGEAAGGIANKVPRREQTDRQISREEPDSNLHQETGLDLHYLSLLTKI
jgi:hypothetical protein